MKNQQILQAKKKAYLMIAFIGIIVIAFVCFKTFANMSSSRPSSLSEIKAQEEFQAKFEKAQKEFQQKVDIANKETEHKQLQKKF